MKKQMGKTKQQEIQEEIDADRIMEYSNEQDDAHFEDWKGVNIDSLKDEFIENMSDEFNDYCRGVFKDE